MLHNGFGLLLGYFGAKFFGLPIPDRRAIAIEVGMQNSALAASLAMTHFTPQAAVAGAVFSIIHNFTGSIFAGFCRKNDSKNI